MKIVDKIYKKWEPLNCPACGREKNAKENQHMFDNPDDIRHALCDDCYNIVDEYRIPYNKEMTIKEIKLQRL